VAKSSEKEEPASDISDMAIDQLKKELEKAIEEEDYERASRLKAEMDRRK
jgi:protein-arginine kinase activator protein McsA